MERAFSILAALFLIASTVQLWLDRTDAAFVLATLGALSWFVGFRIRVARLRSAAEATEREADDSDDSHEN